MKVFYLTANPNRASSNAPTEDWFRLLPQRGLQPVLASASDGAFCAWTRSQGIPTHVIPLPAPDRRRPWVYASALWKLRRCVRASGAQLIHAIEQNVFPIAGDLARLCGLPVVVGVHCRMQHGFAAWAFGARRRPDRLIFLTEGSREVCRPSVHGVVPESAWRILPNGIDLHRFSPDPAAGRRFRADHGLGDGPLIGAASWLRPGKQLEHLFQVTAGLRNDVTLVLAGGVAPGEEVYADELLRMGDGLLGRRLRFLGCLDDLRGFYSALDLCVNTSKEETCSISIIESLACGCPVIGYPSVSVEEQVMPWGGEIVVQDDRDELTCAVDRWITDKDRRVRAGIGARQHAESRFDICRLSDRLWDEYQGVLSESARSKDGRSVSRRGAMSEASPK